MRIIITFLFLTYTSISIAQSPITCDQVLFSESFESGIPAGWSDIALDAYKSGTSFNSGWVIDRDTTFTAGAGPDGAQDGTFYAYCDGSGPIGRGAIAATTTPPITIGDVYQPVLSFYLSMHGQSGDFFVNVIDGGVTTNVLPAISGNVPGGIHTSDQWVPITVDLSAYANKTIQLQFASTKPGPPTTGPREGDIAIDNIVVCSQVQPIPTLGEWSLIILALLAMIVGVLSVVSHKQIVSD